MTPRFRFTLFHPSLPGGNSVIREPLGWKQATLKLEQDPKFYSLVEYFDVPLNFYGDGLGVIRDVQALEGVDSTIGMLVEILFEGTIEGFEKIFRGLVANDTTDEASAGKYPYKAKLAIIRDDLWAKFISRMETPVDFRSAVNLYGQAVTPMQVKTLRLPSQKIRTEYQGDFDKGLSFWNVNDLLGQYIQVDPPEIIKDGVKTRFSIGTALAQAFPAWTFAAEFDGDYVINWRVEMSLFVDPGGANDLRTMENPGPPPSHTMEIRLYKNGVPSVLVAVKTEHILSGTKKSTVYSFSGTLGLLKGDRLQITSEFNYSAFLGDDTLIIWGKDNTAVSVTNTGGTVDFDLFTLGVDGVPSGSSNPSTVSIIADTIFPDSQTEGFLLHDAFKAALDRISIEDSFYAPFLGHTAYTSVLYDAIGCAFRYFLAKGLHVRGYLLAQKSFFASFMNIWEGSDPVLNLALGYETILGEDKIVIDKKEAFFDDSGTSVNFYNVDGMRRTYDIVQIVKKIKQGYKKWESEFAGVMNDPQTEADYATRFERVGIDVTLLSEFIAAATAWETTRRQGIEKEKDWKFDNDILIASINPVEVEADTFTPELDENFSGIANVINSDSAYNIRLWPVWNLLRWSSVFAGALQKYILSTYKFVGAEGNYDAEAIMSSASECLLVDEPLISQKADIPVNTELQRGDYLHSEELYECIVPLAWTDYKTIRDNRKLAIGVSRDHNPVNLFFIKSLTWTIYKAQAKLLIWPKPALVTPDVSLVWQWESGDFVQWDSSALVNLQSAP